MRSTRPVLSPPIFLPIIALSMLGASLAAASTPMDEARADLGGAAVRAVGDDRPHPLGEKARALREAALQAKLDGKAHGRVHEVARGQFVELQLEGTKRLWTVLGEFPDLEHNQIAEPDRAYDNTTFWVPDFDADHYRELFFGNGNSLNDFYGEQSSGRFGLTGDVTDWVAVPNPAATYDDDLGGPAIWGFLQDAIDAWYDARLAAGQTPAQIDAYLAQFDVWDRYDYDQDGVFDEPDGYIDVAQFVHAGEGNEAGGGVLGDDAIWSHSWFAFYNLWGVAGPAFNLMGGVRIGDSSYWVGKYTVQPENGGAVFAHELGHDLGLPDLYDTSGGENGTGFWTLMSSGNWLGDGLDCIGTKSSHMGAWEKFQLGWLNYEVAVAGAHSTHKLGPMEANTKQAQGLFVILPKKAVVTSIGAPYAGSYYYYSGAGDRLDNTMVRGFLLGAGATVTAKVKYQIELDWDYAYLIASTDGGATWTSVPTNLSTTTNPNGQNFGFGITGTSGDWVDLTADLSGYAGDVMLGFRYWTDANTGGFGFMADEITVSGYATDGAETDFGWTFDGFHVTDGTETAYYNHYYVAEFRQYRGYDSTLRVGPYFFGYMDDPLLVNYVDHFPYQDGLLVNYWDTSQRNNRTGQHPGHGLLLPIDAHPTALYDVDGGVWRNRIQTYDSTFGLEPTDPIPNLHVNSVLSSVPSLPAVPVFDDRITYYDPANPQGSVINPNTGTQIRVVGTSAQGTFMQVEVRPAK